MIYQIIGLDGPHIKVISHILKKCGLNIGESNDDSDFKNYTKSNIFEQFYRHLGQEQFDLEQPYINEFYGFVKNINENEIIVINEFRDLICTQYLVQSPFSVKVIYVQYDYVDINNDFLNSIDETIYNKFSSQLNDFIGLVSNNSQWELVVIDYNRFLVDDSYRSSKLIEIIDSEQAASTILNLNLIKTTTDPDDIEDTEFAYLVAQYNDIFASNLLSNIIENIQSEDSNQEPSDVELEQYVKNQNSKT